MDRYLKARITRRTRSVVMRAEAVYEVKLGDVTVRYDLEGPDLAIAWRIHSRPHRFEVSYNLPLARKDPDHVVFDIIPHEVAHLVCFRRPDLGKGHGKGWRAVCRALGGTGEKYHLIEVD